MANEAQKTLIREALEIDRAGNYSRLEYYLRQIIAGRDVTIETRGENPIVLSASEAWDIIFPWAQAEGNLPVGDRKGSAKRGAALLLNYLETNVSGKAVEAAASHALILEQASNQLTPIFPSQDPSDYNLQKIFNLRHLQEKILWEQSVVGKIYTELEKAKILEDVPKDSRTYVLRMLAAGHQNLRSPLQSEKVYTKSDIEKLKFTDFTPEKIKHLLMHTPGAKNDINQVIRLLSSKNSQDEIRKIVEIFENTISQEFPDKDGEKAYQKEMSDFYNLSSLTPNLSNISYLVNCVDVHASQAERNAFAKSLRTQIVLSASNRQHLDGETLVENALIAAGLSKKSLDSFKIISSYIEEIEIKERHLLLGSNLSDHDSRLLSTSGLAAEIGVSLEIPWMKQNDLESAIAKLTGSKDPRSLQAAFDLEIAKGKGADLTRLKDLTNLLGKHSDYLAYHKALEGNFGYQLQELLGKTTGNYFAAKEPLDRFTQKIWGGITTVDDFIHYPQHQLAEWIEQKIEKYPWLSPGTLLTKKWAEYQTSIALRIHAWAIGIPAESSAWLKSFAGHIGDFTEGFIKHEANWGDATSFFTQRKIGNILEWGTKKFTSHKDFTAFKASIGKASWESFSKLAPGLAAKMAASELGKAILGFVAGELTLGASIAIQIGWEALKSGFSKIWSFAKKIFKGDISDLGGIGTMALGSLFLALNSILGGIPAAIIFTLEILKTALKIIWEGFLALLALAALVAAIALVFVVLIWYGLTSPTFVLDSGVSNLVASIICDESGNTTIPGTTSLNTPPTPQASGTSSVLARASCLAKYLNQCYGTSVNRSNISSGLSCLATYAIAPAAIDEIKNSAISFTNLQCVGFVKAAVVWAGQSISSNNACGYVSDPKFVSGLSGVKPGDAIVFNSSGTCGASAPGHIGILKEDAGANVCLIDANQQCPGCVVDGNCLPKTNVAGYLRL